MSEELTRKQDSKEKREEYGVEERGAALPEDRAGGRRGETARQVIRRAKQVSRRKFPAEEKIRIVMEGIRAEVSVADLCRREGIHPTIYYKWRKDFMEAGRGRLRQRIRDDWDFLDPAEMTMVQRFTSQYGENRYSFGCPAGPDLEDQVGLRKLLKPQEIGV